MIVIENTLTEYKELFTIEFRHPAFELVHEYIDPVTLATKNIIASSIFENISVVPDTATRQLFIDRSIDYHYKNTEMTCFARVQGAKLYVGSGEPISLRFLQFANTEFFRRTNIVNAGSVEVYQFTNVARTGGAGNRHLSKQVIVGGTDDLKLIGTVNPEQNCLAVIDISSGVSDAGYRLFNAGILESPEFVLSFDPI
jgi:hypothetical protein